MSPAVQYHRPVMGVFGLILLLVLGCACTAEEGRCITSNATAGRCVVLEACPRLKTIFDKSYKFQSELNLLIGAAAACSKEDHFCCENPVRVGTTSSTAKTQSPDVDVEGVVQVRLGSSDCLQSRLGREFDGAPSLTASFAVFIATGSAKDSRCVGSLITPEYVLTAAHCVRSDRIVLYVNAHHVTWDDNGGLEGDVEPRYAREVISHEQYSRKKRDNDIALIRLNETVPYANQHSPRPICIPMDPKHDETASEGQMLHSFGWGVNAEGVQSESRQWVTLERISLGRCRSLLDVLLLPVNKTVGLSVRNICTISITGHDAYEGYSGAPMMFRKDGTWFLMGIVNYGVGGTGGEFPVVSINVQQYTGWILETIHRVAQEKEALQ